MATRRRTRLARARSCGPIFPASRPSTPHSARASTGPCTRSATEASDWRRERSLGRSAVSAVPAAMESRMPGGARRV
eukprot:2288034-Rhodomonas_salina.1